MIFAPFARLSERRLLLGLTGFVLLAMGLDALFVGADANWDLRNYHFYLGYAGLHGANPQNLFPAQAQSWLNPALDMFVVGLMELLPPRVLAVVLAAIQSLNAPLLYLIAYDVLPVSVGQGRRRFVAVIASILGVTCAMMQSEIGTSFGDNILSILSLAAITLLLRPTGDLCKSAFAAGALFGAGCGLKITGLLYLPGLIMLGAYIFHATPRKPDMKQTVRLLAVAACGVVAGVLVTGGIWLMQQIATTGNPVFPFMNALFQSPLYDTVNYFDDRFKITNWYAALMLPWQMLDGNSPGAEIGYTEPRLFVTLVAIVALVTGVRKNGSKALALCVFFLIGLIIWAIGFGIQRYALLLWLLAGPIIVAGVVALWPRRIHFAGDVVIALLILIATFVGTQAPDWGHGNWSMAARGNWFRVHVPAALRAPGQDFLMLGDEPMTYALPFFGADARFIRMQGNFKPSPATELFKDRATAVMAPHARVWSLGISVPTAVQRDLLAAYGLAQTQASCMPITSAFEILVACPLRVL